MSAPDLDPLLALDLTDEANRRLLGDALAAAGRDAEARLCRVAGLPIRVVGGRVVGGPPTRMCLAPASPESRNLGVLSLLAALGPVLGILCLTGALPVRDAPRGVIVFVLLAFWWPAAGIAFGVAGVRWGERASPAAGCGLLLNLVWVGLGVAAVFGGCGRGGGGVDPSPGHHW